MVEVNCTLISKENSTYIRTVSLDSTRDGEAQRLTDNLVPYTKYTATCLVFKDGVDQCYIGSDTTQTYTAVPKWPTVVGMYIYTYVYVRSYMKLYTAACMIHGLWP